MQSQACHHSCIGQKCVANSHRGEFFTPISVGLTLLQHAAHLAECDGCCQAERTTRRPAGSRGRRPAIQQLGNGGDKLRRGEWLGQKDAVGNAI
jgi:hypothetical protein